MTDSAITSREPRALPRNAIVRLFGSGDAATAYELVGRPSSDALEPCEVAAVAGAAPRRVHSFTAGRLCAHAALRSQGQPRRPLLPRPDGQPNWPAEAPGSIAHTDGYAICAVLSDLRANVSIGVDAEAENAVTEEVFGTLFTPSERQHLASLDAGARRRSATIMFCVKEAFYKAQFRVTGAWVDFSDVEVGLGASGATLYPAANSAPLLGHRRQLSAGFVLRQGVIVAGVVIPRSG